MEHARPPAELCLEGGPAARADSWRKWRKLFEVFLKASGVSKEPKEIQASLLVNLIGSAGYEVFTTFKFDAGESEDDISCILRKFETYFGAKPNITVRRFKFFTRNQEEAENIDQYVTALRVLSQQCEFGELHESLLRDKIVCGINNNTVRDRLLRTDDLTLSRTIQICQAAEISKEERQCIDGTSGSGAVHVDAMRGGTARARARGGRGGARARHGPAWRRGGGGGGARAPCPTCGSGRCPGDERCAARDALCYVCEKKGHFSRVCVHKKALREVLNLSVNTEESAYEESDEELFYVDTIGEDKRLIKSSNELVTDNGPAYSSNEFKNFMGEWEVRHVTSSPHHPQSNGKSERTVQTVKNMLKKCVDSGQDFSLGLLNLRATPRDGLDSPAQILMGRRLNTKLPASTKLLSEKVDNKRNHQVLMAQREKQRKHYNRSARSLERISPGDKATMISNGSRKPVTVVSRASEPRSFIVEDESGRQLRRTRCQLVVRQAEPVRSTARSSSCGVEGNTQGLLWQAGSRRRKKIVIKAVTTPVQAQPSHTSAPVSSTGTTEDDLSLSENDSDSNPMLNQNEDMTSSSSPIVPITRSRERTARMLTNLFFGSNKE